MYELTCPVCTKSFTAIKPDAVYCGVKCRKKASHQRTSKKAKKNDLKIAVLDFETDPFKYGQSVKPFAYGLMLEGGEYYSSWESDKEVKKVGLITHLLDLIESITESHIIYAHNGGRFDFFFLLEQIYNGIPSIREDKRAFFLISNRITRIVYKQHEFRDSYSIMPVPLKTSGNKLEMDYALMHKSKRNKHRTVIDDYLKQDCKALLDMVIQYRDIFAPNGASMPLTMASAAFKELKKRHEFKALNRAQDATFREFYAGGHTQYYEIGIIHAPEGEKICLFDVNSEYPTVMKYYKHPVGNKWTQGRIITENTFFVEWTGKNYGAVFARDKSGINFTSGEGNFKTTIHEYNTALELGLIAVDEILITWDCEEYTTFSEFVDDFFNRRLESAANGDDILVLFWKLVLNSAYGKFGQNAENFGNYCIVIEGSDEHIELINSKYFVRAEETNVIINDKRYIIIKMALSETELDDQSIYNVATAASITGAARALLMRGLHTCNIVDNKKVLYCDTDSLFTYGYPTSLDVVKDKTLGKWNFEASGQVMAIAGKKQYALFDRPASVVLNNPDLVLAYNTHKWEGETIESFACRYKSKTVKPVKGFAWIPTQGGDVEYWACCKLATKGTRLAPQHVVNMALDKEYSAKYDNDAPTFNLNGQQRFISRITKSTGDKSFSIGKKPIFIPTMTKSIKRSFELEEFN